MPLDLCFFFFFLLLWVVGHAQAIFELYNAIHSGFCVAQLKDLASHLSLPC